MSTRAEAKDAAFVALSDLLAKIETAEAKVPAFAFAMYPELRELRDQAKTARAAVNAWLLNT